MCLDCRDYMAVKQYEYWTHLEPVKKKAQMEKRKRNNRKRYQRRKAEGICVYCGKRDAQDNRIDCRVCREKNKRRRIWKTTKT